MIGADPEILLRKKNGEGFIADRIFDGDKNNHIKIGNGCDIHNDGVAVEYNIPPTDSLINWKESHTHVLNFITRKVNGYNVGKKEAIIVTSSSSLLFNIEELAEKRQYSDSGCIEVHNVNKMCEQEPLRYEKNNGWRYAGGHVHISWDNPTITDRITLTRLLDINFSKWVWDIPPHPKLDWGSGRGKTVLGELGNMRYKDYGIEYRTPSNFWIFDIEQISNMFRMIKQTIFYYNMFEKHLNENMSLNQNILNLILEIEEDRKSHGIYSPNWDLRKRVNSLWVNKFINIEN